ncbi:hypothetical protein ACU4GD_37215 [Cupriavidus basilensis]
MPGAAGCALPARVGLRGASPVPTSPRPSIGLGLPFSAALVGAKLVLPGPGASMARPSSALFDQDGAPAPAGVPTVWARPGRLYAPHGKSVATAWNVIGRRGMLCRNRPGAGRTGIKSARSGHDRAVAGWHRVFAFAVACTKAGAGARRSRPSKGSGRAGCSVMKIVDADGAELPWDGRSAGDLLVRATGSRGAPLRHGGILPGEG